ncbi:hypothetical protein L208DRAFT_1246359, partial [Tricholoma matsutake]
FSHKCRSELWSTIRDNTHSSPLILPCFSPFRVFTASTTSSSISKYCLILDNISISELSINRCP